MPCPLFLPELLRDSIFLGRCAADPAEAISVEKVRACCNPGYARVRCLRADEAEADAVNFLMKSETLIAWSIERNHHPVAVGTADAASPNTGNVTLDAQIAGFAAATKPLRP
jgi:hypothetical protein